MQKWIEKNVVVGGFFVDFIQESIICLHCGECMQAKSSCRNQVNSLHRTLRIEKQIAAHAIGCLIRKHNHLF